MSLKTYKDFYMSCAQEYADTLALFTTYARHLMKPFNVGHYGAIKIIDMPLIAIINFIIRIGQKIKSIFTHKNTKSN